MSKTYDYVLLFLFLLNLIVINEAARILAVFPTPSISHQVVFRPLTQELVRFGHEVIVITPDPFFSKGKTPINLTEIDVHDISYAHWKIFHSTSATSGKQDDLYNQMKIIADLQTNVFETQLQSSDVQEIIKDKTKSFDLILIEACSRPALVFSHIYKAPIILVSSFGAVYYNYYAIGAPTHPILYPSMTRQRIYNLTFWEKISEVYNEILYRYLFSAHVDVETEMLRRNLGIDVPAIEELYDNVHMIFLNTHPIWEGNFPVPPGVIYMWGIHKNPEKELPNYLNTYLESSKKGVIYISFGTNVSPSLLPKEKIQILVKVFSQLPYDVLWKWDKDELPGRTKNIRLSKWLPQPDLLHEAITAGVPLIGIPMLGDQWYNVVQYVHHKIGLRLDMETLTEESFRNAINTVIDDESYRHNIIRLRSLMQDQPESPLERVVWWTEHVLRHGSTKHLRSPAANISWTEYYELHFINLPLLYMLTFVTLLIVLTNVLWKMFTSFKWTDDFKKFACGGMWWRAGYRKGLYPAVERQRLMACVQEKNV